MLNKFIEQSEASDVQETSLKEEIETMKLYMSIENIRFSNRTAVCCLSSLNLETIKIPPLVLQPFLENCF